MDNLINITSDSENINIQIPIDLLVFAQENRDPSLIIYNFQEMAEYFKEYFLDFGRDESKGSDFEDLLDDFFYDAVENGETWVEYDEYATDD